MTPDEVLAEFAKLPLPQKMPAAADVLDEADARYGSASKWSPITVRAMADKWKAEDAKVADRERIVNELTAWLILVTEPRSNPISTHRLNARALLDRFPHIAEGWPKA